MFTIEEGPISAFVGQIWRLFGDPWLLMIAVGALGHQLSVMSLVHVSYWNAWLLSFALQVLWPLQSQRKLLIKPKESK